MTKRIEGWLLILAPLILLAVPQKALLASEGLRVLQGSPDAAQLFEQNCAKCHGKDGRAKTVRGKLHGARNLTDPNWQKRETDAEIAAAIKKGPKAMPSFEKKLSQAEIESLVAFVRSLKRMGPEKK